MLLLRSAKRTGLDVAFGRAAAKAMPTVGVSVTQARALSSAPGLEYLKHRPVMNLHEARGFTMSTTFVAPCASVVGDVRIIDHSCVWYGAVIRGDKNKVKIGAHVHVGDKAVINTVGNVDTGFSAEVSIESWVVIEPGAVLTSCMIGNRCKIGAGAVVAEGSVMDEGAQIAAGTVVPPGCLVPKNELWAGNPAKFVRKLSEGDVAEVETEAERRSALGELHADEFNPYGQAYVQAEEAVKGLGNIALPLTEKGVDALRDVAEFAPFGHGAETRVDEKVRRAWQIDAERIGLSEEFALAIGKDYARLAADKLGLRANALGVEARLYKLVMYEKGGHFRPHKDTEKEVGMFGTLVVQLPTAQGHTGGALIVRHRSKQRVFAWEDPDGSYAQRQSGVGAGAVLSLPVRCATFYGDCEHELQPVTGGVRLCLLFNLVRTTPGPPPVAAVGQSGSAAQLLLSDAMTAWCRPDSSFSAEKVILPLEHEYTTASLSFDGLKGRDRAMADALRSCRSVDLYLATIVKHERGDVEYGYGHDYYHSRKRRYNYYDDDDDESDAEEKVMGEVFETEVSAQNWIASDDSPVGLRLSIDVEREVLDCSEQEESDADVEPDEGEAMELLFPEDAEPDEREYEGYTGNCSPTLEFWYHRAVLVLWPASSTMRMALRSGVGTALSLARQRSTRYGAADAIPMADLDRIVSLATRTPEIVKDALHTVKVLSLCVTAAAAGLGSSRRFLQLLADGVPGAIDKPGLRSDGVAREMVALVNALGWSLVRDDVMRLVKACKLEQARNVAVLAQKLYKLRQQPQQDDVKVEVHLGQQQTGFPPVASDDNSSVGVLIARTYAESAISNPGDLERVTASGAAGFVRLLLLDLPSFNSRGSGTTPQLLAFAEFGSSRLPTVVLAAAIHQYRVLLEGSADSASASSGAAPGAGGGKSRLASHHSSAVVTLATGLTNRSFLGLEAMAVKTFAEDVLWLVDGVDGGCGLEQGFANAMLLGVRSGEPSKVRGVQSQLKAVFQSKTVQAAVRSGGGGRKGFVLWKTLASERLTEVQSHAPPVLSWEQPNAILAEHPQVQHFLRGPERAMTYTRSGTFSDLQHARNFCRKYFGSYFSRSRHFSATATPHGRGRSAYVVITKSEDEHKKRVRAHKEDEAEAAVLLALLGKNYYSKPGAAAGGSVAGGIVMSKGKVERVAASDGTGTVDVEVGVETTRSGATLVTVGDDVSLGDTSITTLEDFSTPANTGVLKTQKEVIDNLRKENDELRRHVKRRTQALDTIRRSYIIDVDRLKRGLRDQVEGKPHDDLDETALAGIPSLDFRPVLELFAPTGNKFQMSPCGECGGTLEIVHYDEKEIVKLRGHIDVLREELVENGKALGHSHTVAETYRQKAETSSAEFSELNNMLLREMKALKDKLVDAGPDVVMKISEERDKAESRLRVANRRVSELEEVVLEIQRQLDQVAEENIKVAEMEHHLVESSKEVKAISFERDLHASAVDELRATVASLEDDVRQAADKNAKLLKDFQHQEENNRRSIERLRKLLENSKTSEVALRDEVDALREENLHLSLAGDYGDGDSDTDDRLHQREGAEGSDRQQKSQSATGGFLLAVSGEQEVAAPQSEKSDKMLAFELTEALRRKDEELEYLREKLEQLKNDRERAVDNVLMERELEAAKKQAGEARSTVESTAAVGEDILSGAYARREEQAAIEIADLKGCLAKIEAQVLKVERENKKILKMWNATRTSLWEAERADCMVGGDQTPPRMSTSSKTQTSQETVGGRRAGRRSVPRGRYSTKKGAASTKASKEKREAVLAPFEDAAAQGVNVASAPLAPPVAAINDVSKRNVDNPTTALESHGAADGVIAFADCAEDDETDDVMGVAISYLEEDCRLLRAQKRELQDLCATLKSKSEDLADRLGELQSSFEQERQGRQETERALEERRELLSKATLAVAEHSMALHEAQEGTEKVKEELESERQESANLRLKLKEMGALHSALESGLKATKISLELKTIANTKAEAAAERNAMQADLNALRAEGNACWANAEGMRAEEAISRRFLADEAATKKVAALSVELEKSDNEVKRRRREAKEHAEQMKEFRQCVSERAKLEEEVTQQHQLILDMRQKISSDEAVIEELKLQVVLLDKMRKEVLRLEGKMERLQTELAVTTASLDTFKNHLKTAEHQLHEKTSLSRSLWAALVGAIFLVDDWCAGPLLAWRDTDPAATPSVLPKPPFEARGVDNIMKLRQIIPCGGDAGVTPSNSTSRPEGAAAEEETTKSIQDRLEGQRPKDIKAWLDFRVQVVAGMNHGDRVDSARSEQLLLESICKQRAAQVLNVEEALRRLDATRAALQEEYDTVVATKEELSKTVQKQCEALLDNSRELRKFAALKVDHEVEVRRHEKVATCLRDAEVQIKRLNIRIDKALGVAAMAKNAAQEAEAVRNAAVAEREAAVHEVKVIRETMERGKEQADSVKKQLHELVKADETRLATNKHVASAVAYGDFTEEAASQTSFLCPELTIRQLRRRNLSAAKNLAPESVGRVVPSVKHLSLYDHLGSKWYGGTTCLACDQLHEEERGGRKRWKRGSCSAFSKRNRGWSPSYETSQPGEETAIPTTGGKTLKITVDRPQPPSPTEHPERSWTQAQHHPSVPGAPTSIPNDADLWSFRRDNVTLPMIA
eukprot:g2029.t1